MEVSLLLLVKYVFFGGQIILSEQGELKVLNWVPVKLFKVT